MKLLRLITMGLRGLSSKPARTALSALGIVIGVSAVIALTSLGNGIRASVSGQITDLGSNLITVTPGGESDDDGFIGAAMTSVLTVQDAQKMANLPTVKAASPVVVTRALAAGEGVQLMGVAPAYDEVRKVSLESGRFIENEGEIVLSQEDATRLLGGSADALGQRVSLAGSGGLEPLSALSGSLLESAPGEGNTSALSVLGGQSAEQPAEQPAEQYEVVGVLAPPSEEGSLLEAASSLSFITTTDALTLAGTGVVGQVLASAADADKVDEAKADITAALRANHGGQEDFTVETQADLLSAFTQITTQLNVFLAGIAGISLLVGGIGIMNIMLVSVTERTREIGVRKALGATDGDILLQFLFESVLLATLGGLVGVALGMGGSSLLPVLLPDLPVPVFGVTQIALAFGVSALIGVLFGSLPAYRSARLAPVEALRRE